ncbi:glycoside hydrolase family 6 protein [Streptomyces sp. NPDC059849]|uniref:glycoside hydrolase family 6 protein n=1 Tax=Streptomyces sp. NPDC059849 TaxID=3346969 RepID=UPI003647C749
MYGSHDGRRGVRTGRRTGRRTGPGRAGAVAAAGAVLLLAGCTSGPEAGTGPARGATGRSPGGERYWVNPDGNAARQVAAYKRDGDGASAALIERIARQPLGEWIGPDTPEAEAKGLTEAAAQAGREPLLVLYNIPHRDCGQFSSGGAADGNAYRTWLEGVARGIGDRRATVILEPDALLHMVDGCTPQEFHEERYDLLKGAVERLGRQPGVRVYVDAGNAGWRTPDALFRPLRRAGIGAADGFAVNVSNFQTTQASTEFGKRLSAKVGGKPFVIDTSRNGNGPYRGGAPGEDWCNPPGRALGDPPTTDTGDGLVDAHLWIKRPGESDGDCGGGPKAGAWWPEYALGLARAAK